MKKTSLIYKIILIALVVVSIMAVFVGCAKTEFKRAEDTAFSVLQVSDVHIKNNKSKDKKAFDTIRLMVETTAPDMIIVTGDVTSEHDNLTAIKTFCNFMEGEIKLPWAFTYGNHDAEGEVKKTEISNYLETLEYCIFEKGDENVDGEGNYYYNVKDKEGKVIQSLIMMDSNMYLPDTEIGGYDKFHDNQIEWYEKTVKSIARDVNGDESKVVPSLAFFHIPMREFDVAYAEAKEKDEILYGKKREDVFSSKVDDLMFEKMLELQSTKGMFVGHDHMNNFNINYKGVRMVYANSCDHNIYLVPHRGGVLVNIKNDGKFTTQSVVHPRTTNHCTVGAEI